MARPTHSVADHPPARGVEKSEGEERGNEVLVVDMPDRKEERGRVRGSGDNRTSADSSTALVDSQWFSTLEPDPWK